MKIVVFAATKSISADNIYFSNEYIEIWKLMWSKSTPEVSRNWKAMMTEFWFSLWGDLCAAGFSFGCMFQMQIVLTRCWCKTSRCGEIYVLQDFLLDACCRCRLFWLDVSARPRKLLQGKHERKWRGCEKTVKGSENEVKKKWKGSEKEVKRKWKGSEKEVKRKWKGSEEEVKRKWKGSEKEVKRKCLLEHIPDTISTHKCLNG